MSLPILLFGIPNTKQALRTMLQSATTKIRQKTNTTSSMNDSIYRNVLKSQIKAEVALNIDRT